MSLFLFSGSLFRENYTHHHTGLVGKNDGSVDEMRYFQTTANRGVFVKSEDLAVAL